VPTGWLIRLRVRSFESADDLGLEVIGVDGAWVAPSELPWPLPWRGHGRTARMGLESGDKQLVRLALFRPIGDEVVLFRAPSDGGSEQRMIARTRSEVGLSIRVRRGVDVVAEARVVIALRDADEATPPSVTIDSTAPPFNGQEASASPGAISEDALVEEARRFGEQSNSDARRVGWGSLPYIQRSVAELLDIVECLRAHLENCDRPRALTLACGDMLIEYGCLKRAGVAEIDAFDLSEGQRDKFFRDTYDGKVAVNYRIGDVNSIELEPDAYDAVFLYNGYHHIEALEHVADQIRRALKPDGIFAIQDYVGANSLQRTERQKDVCGPLWRAMPERYRIGLDGRVAKTLYNPDKASLPPFEAIRSQDILDVLRDRFLVREMHLYGGILVALFQGFAHCYTDSEEDQQFVRLMWDLDRWLIGAGAVEPNFAKAVFVQKPEPRQAP